MRKLMCTLMQILSVAILGNSSFCVSVNGF